MFCVLKINRRNQTIFEKLFGSFIKDEYNLSAIPVFKGAPFYLLDVCIGKKGIDWEKVLSFVGKCASRLVVNSEIEIPENMNIGVYKSKKLYDKMRGKSIEHTQTKTQQKSNVRGHLKAELAKGFNRGADINLAQQSRPVQKTVSNAKVVQQQSQR